MSLRKIPCTENFLFWLKSQKKGAKSQPSFGGYGAVLFFGDLSQSEKNFDIKPPLKTAT